MDELAFVMNMVWIMDIGATNAVGNYRELYTRFRHNQPRGNYLDSIRTVIQRHTTPLY